MRKLLALIVVCCLAAAGCARGADTETTGSTPRSPAASATTTTGQPRTESPTPTETTSSSAGRVVTTTMNGDLLWHDTLWKGPAEDARRNNTGTEFDFKPLWAELKPVIEGADFSVCHEEVPFAKQGGPYTGYPMFKAPPAVAKMVKDTGWDACTTSSNHSLDAGWTGLVRTIDEFEKAGVLTTGTFRSAAERAKPMIYTTASGVKIALVSGTYGTNGIPLPADKPWSVAMWDADDMIARAKIAREAGANIVMAVIHGGDEYSSRENADQRARAQKLTASPYIDLVYGHHVHVVQPWTQMNGKWVVYGLGNLIAQHKKSVVRGYEGVTARFTWTEQPDGTFKVSKAEYIPTIVSDYSPSKSARVYMISKALKEGKYNRTRLLAAQDRTRKVVRMYNPPGLIES